MDFLNSFVSAWEEEPAEASEPDESRAPNVNVLLRKARALARQTASATELKAELTALREASERGAETLANLERSELRPLVEPALAELSTFGELLTELEAWSETPAEDPLSGLRDRLVACGERLLELQSRLALEAHQTRDTAAGTTPEEQAVPVSPEIARLYRLTRELPDSREPWSTCLSALQNAFRVALVQAQATLAGRAGDAEVEGAVEGLECALAGILEMGAYRSSQDPQDLDTGWATLLEGMRMLQASEGSLRSRLTG